MIEVNVKNFGKCLIVVSWVMLEFGYLCVY